MKLLYPRLNFAFSLQKNVLNSLVLESSRLMDSCVVDLYNDINGLSEKFMLSDDEEPLSIPKNMAVIMSPVDFAYDKREISKKFLSYLKREIDESDLSQKIVEKYSEMRELVEELYYMSEIPLEYNDMITENDIFKHFDIHIKAPEGSFAEKVIQYGSVLKRLTDKKVIVLANCEAYIELQDYEFLRKYVESEEFYMLLISNKQLSRQLQLNDCIIDKDMCELY